MWKAVCVVFCCGLLAVKGDISELDNFKDQDQIRIGAFNIRTFGKAKFEKPEVAQELVKILSRYDIVLVQEIRDLSETYIYKLLEKLNNETRSEEPFSLVVSERLGKATHKEQYAFLYRETYVTKLDVYQYEDPNYVSFQRPPYAVKFHSDVLDTMHEFGIIGLHTSPGDAFKEINALSLVYDKVKEKFKTPHILIAGDLNADCSYLSQKKMKELSIRNDTSYKWLIDDYEDTTVSGTNCAYDRFIIKENAWPDIIPASVQVYHYEREHKLTKEMALNVSDHYPIEMELRKCYGNRALLQTNTPSFSITVEDDRVISSADLTYVRHIYQKTNERIPQWSAQIYEIENKMNYVTATRTKVNIAKAIEEIFLFYEAFQRKVLSLEAIASLRKLLEELKCFREPHIYCMNTAPLSVVDLAVTCTLVDPLTCKIDVSRRLS